MSSANWQSSPIIRDLLEKVRKRILEDTNGCVAIAYQPLVLYISPHQYRWAIDNGWIEPSGAPTEKFTATYGEDSGHLLRLMRASMGEPVADEPTFIAAQ